MRLFAPSSPVGPVSLDALPRLLPVFLRVEGRPCLVVGGGPIGAQKARELAECGARVTVVSPDLDSAWAALLAAGVEHVARRYELGDTDGFAMVVSATGDAAVDERVWDDGHASGALVNVVDVPHRCDWYAGSVVRRGPVVVAVSTSGASPSLAIAVREAIEDLLPATVDELARSLAARRVEFRSRWPEYRARAARLNRAVRGIFEAARNGAAAGDLREAVACAARCERDCANEAECCAAGRARGSWTGGSDAVA